MTYDEVLKAVVMLLQQEGRIAYRGIKRRFDIDDEYVEDLKAELIDAKRVAVDEDGKVLVWISKDSLESSVQSPESKTAEFAKLCGARALFEHCVTLSMATIVKCIGRIDSHLR